MMVSTRGRYALRVMIDLAEHDDGKYIPLNDIANRQDISEKYLESITKLLIKGKLLEGVRGKGGGYRLTKRPDQYTLFMILSATEESLAPVACLEEGAAVCSRAASCQTLPMWRELNSLVMNFYKEKKLSDLIKSKKDGNDFVI